jgi:hypothetical protein
MVNRPAGGARSEKWERADYDWYKEPRQANRQIFDRISFGPSDNLDLIYDPCCGSGWILDEAKDRGHPTLGSDIIDRHPRHHFFRGNILQMTKPPKAPPGRSISVVCNPPYSYETDIAEKVIRKVLETVPARKSVFIVPIAFLAGQNRWAFFERDFKPSHVAYYSQRHTMPPGKLIPTMAKPFEGGMQDYVVLIYTGPRHQWRTESIWLKPD